MKLCALMGAGAVAVMAIKNSNFHIPTPSACSARRAVEELPEETDADGQLYEVSARATSVTDTMDGLWGLSSDAEEQFKGVKPNPLGANSDAVKKAKRDLAPKRVESRGKGNGVQVLSVGRSESTTKPKVSGACMFNMSDEYADRLMEQEGVTEE